MVQAWNLDVPAALLSDCIIKGLIAVKVKGAKVVAV
jgi:hypothetical protein